MPGDPTACFEEKEPKFRVLRGSSQLLSGCSNYPVAKASQMHRKHSRADKRFGDFGEHLVMYTLIRKGFEVACVDHVGADLIADKDQHRIAVSVKARMFRKGSTETQSITYKPDHLEDLEHYARRYDLDPVVAHVACIADDRVIHLFMLRVDDIRSELDSVKKGYRLRFGLGDLNKTIELAYVDYSCWSNERITDWLFNDQRR